MFKNSIGQPLVLGSSSPRRKELLAACGLIFDVLSPDINEDLLDDETADRLVERLSLEKGRAIAVKVPHSWVLSADTVVAIKGEILGKPVDQEDAARMLTKIQGAEHTVYGGICLIHQERGVERLQSFASQVTIKALNSEEISAYIDTGEPMDKAGSYAIQGIGASFVTDVRGSYSNVVGLNISAVIDILREYGVVALAGL